MSMLNETVVYNERERKMLFRDHAQLDRIRTHLFGVNDFYNSVVIRKMDLLFDEIQRLKADSTKLTCWYNSRCVVLTKGA